MSSDKHEFADFLSKEIKGYIDALSLRFRRHKKNATDVPASDTLKNTFEHEIKPKLDLIEKQRDSFNSEFEKRKRLLNFKVFPVVVTLVLLVVALGGDGSFFSTLIFAFCIGTSWAYKPALDYIHFYKRNVMPILVKMYGEFSYSLTSEIKKDEIKKLAISPSFDHIETEDSIVGELDNIGFKFCELKLERSGNNGRHTLFKGCMVKLTMPFNFNSHTIVQQDRGKVANWLTKDPKATQKVELENTYFEQAFEVFSTDQVLARYILTPVMMEQILALYTMFMKKADAQSFVCEFIDNTAIFLISYKANLIEPAWISQSAYDIDALPLIEQELELLTSISKQLNLDLMAARKVSSAQLAANQ
ncbi:DUF3137 domain-containing protein [Pseudoalteromonas spongiae]|uniref:DUF3137 domain-containing protein n=1 Tax=Pseudoalteromonas spongiae TaxID=298657 RepID=UPI000C2D3A36|nr:DUF3137 domain-containing protein [Pseudoalteromonas spongiae]